MPLQIQPKIPAAASWSVAYEQIIINSVIK